MFSSKLTYDAGREKHKCKLEDVIKVAYSKRPEKCFKINYYSRKIYIRVSNIFQKSFKLLVYGDQLTVSNFQNRLMDRILLWTSFQNHRRSKLKTYYFWDYFVFVGAPFDPKASKKLRLNIIIIFRDILGIRMEV